MQALTAWFYPGQPEVEFMLGCAETVAEAVAAGGAEEVAESTATAAAEGATELVARALARML